MPSLGGQATPEELAVLKDPSRSSKTAGPKKEWGVFQQPKLSAPGYVQPNPLPALQMPTFNLEGAFQGGGGGGGGNGGGGGHGGGGGTPPAPQMPTIGTFQGTPSPYMEGVYRKAMEQYNTVPDLYNLNITNARDATTQALREVQKNLVGRLGPGGASPAMYSQIGDTAARNLNKAAEESAGQVFDRRMAALNTAGGMGTGLAGDLRAQEGMGINAYNAQINAYKAEQEAKNQELRMKLDAQIAQMQAMLNIWGKQFDIYGAMMGNMYGNMYGNMANKA